MSKCAQKVINNDSYWALKMPAAGRLIFSWRYLCLMMVLGPFTSWAQNDLPAEQVEILKSFDAQLADVQKIQGFPEVPSIDTTPVQMTFQPAQFDFQLGQKSPDIQALTLEPSKYPAETMGYIQLAGGVPRRLDARALYTFREAGNYNAVIYALHEEASSSYKNYQQWSHQVIGVKGAHHLDDQWTLGIRGAYDRRVNFLYGHPDADSLNAAALRRRLGQFNVGAGITFNSEVSRSELTADVEIWGLLDSYGTSERQTIMNAAYAYDLNNGHMIGADLMIDAGRLRDTLTRRLNNYLLKPYYRFNTSRLNISAGVNIYNHNDEFQFLPDLKLSYALIGSQWQIEAGVVGQLSKNGYRQLISYNPYIQSRIDSLANSTVRNYYLGIKGITRNIQYGIRGGFKNVEDLSLFQFIEEGPATGFFEVLFDDVSYPYLEAYGLIPWSRSTSVELFYNLNFFSPSREEKAWHRPTFESYIKLNFDPQGQRWHTSAQIWLIGGISYQDSEGSARTIDPILDISLTGEYNVSKRFDAFLQIRNLPGNRWSRWINYPVFSANFLVGIQYRIP